jgi:ClpP class serine protease
MGYKERKKMFDSIKAKRKRPLITYVTSIRPGMSCMMAGDAIRPIIDQLSLIPEEEKKVDFLIISNGGDPITSMRIMGLLRERFDEVTVLLPYVAYSAATILSLGADEILMHPYSNLGPVDPQMTAPHTTPS